MTYSDCFYCGGAVEEQFILREVSTNRLLPDQGFL
jgi:hypothetical protein